MPEPTASPAGALILHPIRMRILLALGRGIPVTAQDLAEILPDVARATLYRQLAILVEGGLLEVVSEQRVRGAVERTYALKQGQAGLSADELATMGREDHLRYFASYLASLLDEFARYLRRDQIDLAADSVMYREGTVYLTSDEAADVAREMWTAFSRRVGTPPAPGRRPHTFAAISVPGSGPAPGAADSATSHGEPR
jgi:DNA-binding transcriptional ArsR family regulator